MTLEKDNNESSSKMESVSRAGELLPVSGLKVLLVEDNLTFTKWASRYLEKHGHRVVAAHSGEAALEIVEKERPQVVFLDLGLPGMDGYEVARRLRALKELSGLFIIAMSGYTQPDERLAAEAAGCDGFLVKPVEPAVLLELLSTWHADGASAAAEFAKSACANC